MAKQPQYNGKEMYAKGFEFCKVPENVQTILRKNEVPAHGEATCFIKYVAGEMGMMKEDFTLDVEKVAQQFKDYDMKVPEEFKEMKGIKIDDPAYTEKMTMIMSKYGRDISFAFYGNYDEAF